MANRQGTTCMATENQITLMIIDDDEDDRQWFQIAIERTRPKVKLVKALGGRAAMGYLLSGLTPDLIFLDLNMPGMDGFDFLRAINKTRVKKIPVVAISTSDRPADISKAIHLGAIHYIVKPFSLTELMKKIEEVLTGFLSWQTIASTRGAN